MKKIVIYAAAAALMCTGMTSCMGSFALSSEVYKWNQQVGNKFVNELVFVAFFVLPVYEVCGLADILVLNSIEFWSGDNPMTASVKTVDTDHGRYLVVCDGKGYDVKCEQTGESYRLDFATDTQTWSVDVNGEAYPLMTFVDDSHVALPAADGSWMTVKASYDGVLAYKAAAAPVLWAAR